ncbi:fluoride efflux transporter CrcB [Tessaracoccus rhinocerotis]|uniref:Fluoride-specific ion channel FluC n=1 Tax=Tessaracoccus rhinocerotis TaxID=1689449 RepID=A0A553K0C6_9ACTN|nr:fluoride efflux transporter CrcB [Tessaracoccus rhinocerotis]TRY18145.1 fluoride efflux transporter CrcB [Tessaracoccus rhinocerotis]
MTLPVFLALALAGGLGAVCRFVFDGFLTAHSPRSGLPLGTISINLTGSFALGLLTGLATSALVPEGWHLVLGTGFLGGYTTFSTASFETVRLLQEGRRGTAIVNGLGVVVLATAAAALGLVLGAGVA